MARNMKKLLAALTALALMISMLGMVTVSADEATGYTAKLGYADGDWSVQEWGDAVNTTVAGAGTYTLSYDLTDSASGAVVFVVDIVGAGEAYAGYSVTDMTVTADGADIPVDLTKIVSGDLEGNGNYRIEIYNLYGYQEMTKNDPPIDLSLLEASSNLSVTFTLGTQEPEVPDVTEPAEPDGTEPEVTEPAGSGSYTAALGYTASGWWPATGFGEASACQTAVTGPGTYTLSWDTANAASGAMVLVVDILGAGEAFAGYSVTGMTVTADGVDIPVDLGKLVVGDLEEKGNYRIEIYNEYGTTKADPAIDVSALTISSNLSVTFTLGTQEPEVPDVTEPSEPDVTEPSEPDVTEPSEPDVTEPSEPDVTEPSEPDVTEPSEPDVTEPSEPDVTEPAEPDVTEPSEPDVTEPSEPDVTEPSEPEAPAGFTAKLSYADGDWSVQEWGDTVNTAVTGAGTYTLSYDLTAPASGAMVFVVDIVGAGEAYAGYAVTGLTVTADGVQIPVDLSKIVTGDLEQNGNYRIEIYNEYGSTKADPAIDAAALEIGSNLTVTFTLGAQEPEVPDVTEPSEPDVTEPAEPDASEPEATEPDATEPGATEPGATEPEEGGRLEYSFTAAMGFADADWWPATGIAKDSSVKRSISGAGTYSISWYPDKNVGEQAEGAIVFVVDILGAAAKLAEDGYAYKLTGLSLKADGVSIPVSLSKVNSGDLEGNGNFRIELYNEYGNTKDAFDRSALKVNEKLTVSFTLVIVDAQTGAVVDDSNPATGDSFRPALMLGMMAAAVTAGAVLTLLKKRAF